jgi:hypothetical protein
MLLFKIIYFSTGHVDGNFIPGWALLWNKFRKPMGETFAELLRIHIETCSNCKTHFESIDPAFNVKLMRWDHRFVLLQAIEAAVKCDTLDWLKQLVQQDEQIDLNSFNGIGCGNKLLHLAVNRPDIFEMFLSSKSTLFNLATSAGVRPIHIVCEQADLTTLDNLLIFQGDYINSKSQDGQTPLHWVVRNDNGADMAELLLKKGAAIDSKNDCGRTPLHVACIYNKKDIATVLLEGGADIDALDHTWSTPLHYAVCRGGLQLAEMLLDKGCRPDCLNYNLESPLDLALKNELPDLVRVIKKHLNFVRDPPSGLVEVPGLCDVRYLSD